MYNRRKRKKKKWPVLTRYYQWPLFVMICKSDGDLFCWWDSELNGAYWSSESRVCTCVSHTHVGCFSSRDSQVLLLKTVWNVCVWCMCIQGTYCCVCVGIGFVDWLEKCFGMCVCLYEWIWLSWGDLVLLTGHSNPINNNKITKYLYSSKSCS